MKLKKNLFIKMMVVALWAATSLFAETLDSTNVSGSTKMENATESSVEPVETVSVAEFQAELAVRDSVMAVKDSSCSEEKNALRKNLEIEEAKCANWEQSYNAVKKDNETCAMALSSMYDVSEKNKQKAEEEQQSGAMMASSSFLGGLGVGLLIMWLIMD